MTKPPKVPPLDGCPCGQPLHYSNPNNQAAVEAIVAQLGPTILIHTPSGAWYVPRHYIALHGLAAAELPALAAHYHWEQKYL